MTAAGGTDVSTDFARERRTSVWLRPRSSVACRVDRPGVAQNPLHDGDTVPDPRAVLGRNVAPVAAVEHVIERGRVEASASPTCPPGAGDLKYHDAKNGVTWRYRHDRVVHPA